MSSYLQIQFLTRSPLLGVCSSYTYEDTKPSQTKLRSRDTVIRIQKNGSFLRTIIDRKRRDSTCCNGALFPVDPWAPNVDSQSIASQLFAFSLFPYLGFLYFITKSKTAPRLTLFGFYFLLAFVGATIPAGIYAKVRYGTSLSNVDWLHGGAESLLTLTNIFIVLGLRGALRKPSDGNENASDFTAEANKEENPSI